jgi:DNA polymerase III delta prime subunit
MNKHSLLVEKYRPHTVADCILPDRLKGIFQGYIDNKVIPNIHLTGSSGIGKTSVALAMLDELKADRFILNGSLDRNIDTLRNELTNFASSMSFMGGRKYVVIDEADHLNALTFQPAFRHFIEQYANTCGFIITTNYPNKIIEALHSRLAMIEFSFTKDELPHLQAGFYKRLLHILKEENIAYEASIIRSLIVKLTPDWRKILNKIEVYSSGGVIDSGILANAADADLEALVGHLKACDYNKTRRWAAENSLGQHQEIFRKVYDGASTIVQPSAIPALISIIGKYQYYSAFVADQEINLSAMFADIIMELREHFKP